MTTLMYIFDFNSICFHQQKKTKRISIKKWKKNCKTQKRKTNLYITFQPDLWKKKSNIINYIQQYNQLYITW